MEKDISSIDEDLKQYKAILLSGCATLGAAHLGFLKCLQHRKMVRFLKVVSGTSIGSIIGFLFVLGVPIETILADYRDKNLVDLLKPLSSDAVKTGMGLASADYIIAQVIDTLVRCGINHQLTFKDAYEKTKVHFVVTATKRIKTPKYFEADYFSEKTTPNMMVVDAIRISISIPFIFVMPEYNGSQYCDGALIANLPFEYIIKNFCISEDEMIAHSPRITHKPRIKDKNNAFDYFSDLLDFAYNQLVVRSYHNRTVETEIDIGGAMDLQTSPKIVDYHFYKAISSTNRFINSRNNLSFSLH